MLGKKIHHDRAVYRRKLRAILKWYYQHFDIQIVISHNPRFPQDTDWCLVSKELGIKYVVFYRETFLIERAGYLHARDRHKIMPQFSGDMICFPNSISRRMMIESGFVRKEQAIVTGNPRFDSLHSKIQESFDPIETQGRSVVLFWSPYRTWDSAQQLEHLSERLILMFARAARLYPNDHFKVKLRRHFMATRIWSRMHSALKNDDLDQLSNLEITETQDVWHLIESATVIVGLKSTTTLESAIYGKPILMPVFREFQDHPSWRHYGFRKYLGLFTPCENEEQFFQSLAKILHEGSEISPETMEARYKLFEEYISPLDGKNAMRFRDALDAITMPTDS